MQARSIPASIFFASSTSRMVNTLLRFAPSIGRRRGIPPVASTSVSYETVVPSVRRTLLAGASTASTCTPVRKSTPYFVLSSAGERHSILAGSVMSALLSLVLYEGSYITSS